MIRPFVTRDPSLRSEWHTGRVFLQWVCKILHYRSEWQVRGVFFWKSNQYWSRNSISHLNTHISILLLRKILHYRSEWQGRGVFSGNPTNINPETISHISILTSQFYHYARFFTIVQNDRAGVFFWKSNQY